MHLDPEQASPALIYATMIRAITPRPIAWVSTLSPRGIPNLAPFSYFNGVGSAPAALMFSVVNRADGSLKDTTRNLTTNPQFVVNLVPFALAEKMVVTAGEFAYETSEFEAAGLSPIASHRVAPPQVAESPVRFECEVLQIVNVGCGPHAANVVIGKILWINIADEVLDEQHKIDPVRLDTIGRLGGQSYCRISERFEINR